MIKLILAGSAIAMLGACATVPDVTYRYYPAKANFAVTLTQTISCNSDKSAYIIINTPAVTTTNFADYGVASMPSLRLKNLDGTLSDSDLGITLYDDGRLKSINQSTTGQAEGVLKSAISMGAALAALGGGDGSIKGANSLATECATIDRVGGGKPVTMLYALQVDPQKDLPAADCDNVKCKKSDGFGQQNSAWFRDIKLQPAPGYETLYADLSGLVPTDVLLFAPRENLSGARLLTANGSAEVGCDARDNACLTLQKTQNVEIVVQVNTQAVSTSFVTVPTPATYELPIPYAQLFGTQKFSLTLSEAGAITAIDYAKTTGDGGPLNVGTAAATAAAPNSTAAKAAELKAQGDVIANQQRLNLCNKDPSQCK